MNQDESDEDFRLVEKSDCEGAVEEIKNDSNSQLCLKVFGEQLEKNQNEVDE
jgi:hypothetical protein